MIYKNQCRNIYLSRFSDDGVFSKYLFEKCSENIEYIEKKGEIVSFLFLLPCEIEGERAKYIFAAATKEECEGKGYMSNLLERVIEKENLLFLRPANEKLVGFYERFGFKLISSTTEDSSFPTLKPQDSFLSLAQQIEPDEDSEYPFMYLSKKDIEFEKIYFQYSMD